MLVYCIKLDNTIFMKHLFLILFLALTISSCKGTYQEQIPEGTLIVRYLHTGDSDNEVKGIEPVILKAIEEVDSPRVKYEKINISKWRNKSLARKYGISSPSLMIDNGHNAYDVTSTMFRLGAEQSDGFRIILKTQINKLLK